MMHFSAFFDRTSQKMMFENHTKIASSANATCQVPSFQDYFNGKRGREGEREGEGERESVCVRAHSRISVERNLEHAMEINGNNAQILPTFLQKQQPP